MTDHFDKMTSWKRARAASEESGELAEGVGLLPANRKALKINGRLRRFVCRIYRKGVPVG
jgi:hypothetical protein